MRRFLKLILFLLLIALSILVFVMLRPATYPIPEAIVRTGTQYWSLTSGSHIGYTFLPASADKQPYPVIYLHGGPGGSFTERDLQILQPLTQLGYDVYLYDQVGSGFSNRLEDITQYTVERHINDLKEIIQQIKAEKVILVGQSWGAVLATLFVAEHPLLVDKIIFTSPGPVYPVRQELKNTIAPDSLHLKPPVFTNAQGNQESTTLRSTAINFVALKLHKKLATDKEADAFASYRSSLVNRSVVCDTSKISPPRSGYGFYAALMTYESLKQVADPRSKLKQLTIPVLVVKGQCDNQPWGFTNEYLELFSNHRFAYIPDAGHIISIEQPEALQKAIVDFLGIK